MELETIYCHVNRYWCNCDRQYTTASVSQFNECGMYKIIFYEDRNVDNTSDNMSDEILCVIHTRNLNVEALRNLRELNDNDYHREYKHQDAIHLYKHVISSISHITKYELMQYEVKSYCSDIREVVLPPSECIHIPYLFTPNLFISYTYTLIIDEYDMGSYDVCRAPVVIINKFIDRDDEELFPRFRECYLLIIHTYYDSNFKVTTPKEIKHFDYIPNVHFCGI